MRRLLLTMFCALLCILPAGAFAASADMAEQAADAFFASENMTTGERLMVRSDTGSTAACLQWREGGTTLLILNTLEGAGWQVAARGDHVLWDDAQPDRVTMTFEGENGLVIRASIGTELELNNEDVGWVVERVMLVSTNEREYDVIHVQPDRLVFSDSLMELVDATVYGFVSRSVGEFSFAEFPKDVDSARQMMQGLTETTQDELTVQYVTFSTGLVYALFNGPGEEYGRTQDGTGAVLLDGTLPVFGWVGEWAMIEVPNENGSIIGWVDANALPAKEIVPEIIFGEETRVLTRDVTARNDPANENSDFRSVSAGESVTVLATLNGWSYVAFETLTPRFGFVPGDTLAEPIMLTPEPTEQPREGSELGAIFANYSVSGAIVPDEGNGASLTLSLMAGANVPAEDVPVAYRVMFNQSTANIAELAADADGTLSLSLNVSLPEGNAVIALCPVFPDGEVRTEEMLLLRTEDMR